MNNNYDIEYDDFDISNISSVLNYIKENYIQFILLILVFIIIYIVDHISNINAIIFALPQSVPGLPSAVTVLPPKPPINQPPQKKYKPSHTFKKNKNIKK
jgi:hypothetical protein